MRLCFLICILVFRVTVACAQEREVVPQPLPDSVRMAMPALFEPGLVLPGSFMNSLLSSGMMPLVKVPEFDFSPWLQSRWKIDYTAGINDFQWGGRSPLFGQGEFSGWPGYGEVLFNQASYRLSDKFVLGGNSFGAGSLLSAPVRKPGSDQWEWRGASMFLQYKVSKNFRIETHVSVSGNQYIP